MFMSVCTCVFKTTLSFCPKSEHLAKLSFKGSDRGRENELPLCVIVHVSVSICCVGVSVCGTDAPSRGPSPVTQEQQANHSWVLK